MVASLPCQRRRARRGRRPARQLTADRRHRRAPRWGLGDVAVGLVPLVPRPHRPPGVGGRRRATEPDAEVTIGVLVRQLPRGLAVPRRRAGRRHQGARATGPSPTSACASRCRDLLAFPLGVALQAIVVPLLYWPILQVLDKSTDDVSARGPRARRLRRGSRRRWCSCSSSRVGAPVAEELFYRGLVLRAVEKRWSTAVAARGVHRAVRRRPPPGPPAPGAAPVRRRGAAPSRRAPDGSGRRSCATAASTRGRCSCCWCSTPDPGAAPTAWHDSRHRVRARRRPPSPPCRTCRRSGAGGARYSELDAWGQVAAWSSRPSCSSARAVHARPAGPGLLIADTTPAGGDMGAHVWGPAFLRDHLLPRRPARGLGARLVRRLPRLPVLHGGPGAADRGPRRRAERAGRRSSRWPGRLALLWVALTHAAARCAGGHWSPGCSSPPSASGCPTASPSSWSPSSGLLALPGVRATSPAASPTCRSRARRCSPSASTVFLFNRQPIANATGNIIGGNFTSTLAGEFSLLDQPRLPRAVPRLPAPRPAARRLPRHQRACCWRLTALCHIIPAIYAVVLTVLALLVSAPVTQGAAPVVPAGRHRSALAIERLLDRAVRPAPGVPQRHGLGEDPRRHQRGAHPRPPVALLVGRRRLRRAAQLAARHPRARRHPLDPGPRRRGPRWCR